MSSVCIKIVRRPVIQVGGADESDGENGLIVGLERAFTLHDVNAAGLAAL